MRKQHRIFILFFSTLLFTPIYPHYNSVKHTFTTTGYQTHSSDHAAHKSHDFSHDAKCDNSRIGSSYSHRSDFKQYNTQNFRDHFIHHGYTENQILQQRCLYMFDEFVKFAQTYSSYKCTIQQLHAELKNLSFWQKLYQRTKGTYCRGLQKRIHYLYDQLNTLKTAQQNNNDSFFAKNNCPCISDEFRNYTGPITYDHSPATFPAQQAEYKALDSTYRAYTPSLSNAIEKRIDAYNNVVRVDGFLSYASKSYNLNNNVKQLLDKYGHDTTRFTQCYGNQLDHTIHQESLNLLDRIDGLSSNSLLYDHQEALVDFTIAMVDYNHEGMTDKAMNIGDLCWTLLDYGQAIAEGAALGAYSAVTDLLHNPIEATINIVAGKQVLAYQLCKVLYNVADIGVTALSSFDGSKDKWNKYTEDISNIIDRIDKKEISVRDVLKGGTAFFVGYKTQGKLLGGLGKFCNTIKQKSINFIKNSSLLNPQEYLTTPEGLLFKATAQSDKLKQSGQAAASNLKNSIDNKVSKNIIPEFVQQNRIPLDRETILHSANFRKTKIAPVKGAQVYTKDNLFYHRDTLHKGKGSHLEVYNKQGTHLGEADPLTGLLIKNTADKNKKLNF